MQNPSKINTSYPRATRQKHTAKQIVGGLLSRQKKGYKKHTAKQIVRAFKKKAIKEKKQKKNYKEKAAAVTSYNVYHSKIKWLLLH